MLGGYRNLSSNSPWEHTTEKNFPISTWNRYTQLTWNFWFFQIAIFGEFTIHWKDTLRLTDDFTILFLQIPQKGPISKYLSSNDMKWQN